MAEIKLNEEVARELEEVARLLTEQAANPFRVQAYNRAAATVRGLDRSVADLLSEGDNHGLEKLPGIGRSLATAIQDYVQNGRLPILEQLRGENDPVAAFASVPGIGPRLARRLHDELGLDSLEDLEVAAHDGRLRELAGMGPKRVAGIRDSLAHRLHRAQVKASPPPSPGQAPVSELLEVDEEYRTKAAADQLKRIAPRRFNPKGEAWLPVLHTRKGRRHYTALFSNTARAHESDKTHDWVVLYCDGGRGEQQATVVTARRGPLRGKRVVRGREAESAAYYHQHGEPALAA